MKKLLLVTLEYPPQKGGIASYYGGMVEELQRQKYEVEIISSGLLYKIFWPRWLKGLLAIRRAIKTKKIDLILVGQILPLGILAYFFRKHTPYVLFLHGMDILMTRKLWHKEWVARKILKNAKFIVANSEFTKNQLATYNLSAQGGCASGPQLIAKTIVTYPCPTIAADISPEKIDLLIRRLGISGKKVFLTLGRLVERKGQDIFIKALPEIIQHSQNIVYLVVGNGPYITSLSQLVLKLNLQSYVRFISDIEDDERPLYYNLCDIFIMPSRQIGPDVEGFGLSFLEAALLGKPSIGGRSGGIPEAIIDNKTGLLVNPSDIHEIAQTAIKLLENDKLRNLLGKNARDRTLSEFVWNKQIEPLKKIIN